MCGSLVVLKMQLNINQPTKQSSVSVCLSVLVMNPAKAAELIKMPFGLLTYVRPRIQVLDEGLDPHRTVQF